MLKWLQRLYTAPVFTEDEEKTRIARLLNPILLNLMWVLIVFALAAVFIFPEPFYSAIVVLATLGLLLLARFLLVRGKVQLASIIFIAGLGVDITLTVLFAGGMTSVDNVFYITLLVLTGLLLGRRATILMTISIILIGVGMVILDATHTMPPRIFPVPSRSGLVVLASASVMVAAALNLALKSLNESRARSVKELAERKTIEAALIESEQRFHAIFDSINDAIFVHDIHTGAILDVNQHMCEMYGYTRQEVLQLTIEDMSQGEPPFTQRDALGWFRQIPPGGSRLAEWCAKDKNGRLFWVEVNLRHTVIGGQERMLVTVRDIHERKKADMRRNALYRISDAARAAQDMNDFYQLIHAVIGTLMPAKNFYIALYEPATGMLSYPYYSDEFDQPPPPHQIEKGLTAYVLGTSAPLLATPEVFQQLEARGEVENIGTPSVDWLGTPLRTAHGTLGVLAVQTYTEAERLTLDDLDVLVFVANQVAMMLERKQAEEHDRMFSQGLRAVIEAADELICCDQLDTLYRRVVELAREKIGVERAGLFLLDPESQNLLGTYGTDIQGHTTQEHAASELASNHPYLFNPTDRLWNVRNITQAYWEGQTAHKLDTGWVAGTVIRSATRPIGVLFNDSAITKTPINEAIQEAITVYCSMLGNIIDRKRSEERERDMLQRLHAVVDATDELIDCENLDRLYRRAVELAREKLNVDRCSIFLLDESQESLSGTYGTDNKGDTSDEHFIKMAAKQVPELSDPGAKKWTIHENVSLVYYQNENAVFLQPGWVTSTIIRSADEPIGVFYNDSARKQAPPSETLQETVAVYCSLLGNIIKRMRVEAEQKRLIAELEAKNSELERFAYTVSHDLKSPLITIRGFLGFLEKDAVSGNSERFKTDLGRISEATNKMQQLLNGLLELSRIGRLMNPGQFIPFEEIAREAIAVVYGQIDAFGAQVIVQEGLPTVFGDRARLVEVVQNLLDNAIKFTSHLVSPHINIGTRASDETGKPIFFVSDNGLGIDPQYHDRIFGLFNKLDAQSDGTGIGLSLVKRIVEFHGGRVWVESEGRDQGSTFYFTLPITNPQEHG